MLYILYKYLIVFNDFRNEMLLLEMLQDNEESHLDYVEKLSITATTLPMIFML